MLSGLCYCAKQKAQQDLSGDNKLLRETKGGQREKKGKIFRKEEAKVPGEMLFASFIQITAPHSNTL
jgi:hypothetical protein